MRLKHNIQIIIVASLFYSQSEMKLKRKCTPRLGFSRTRIETCSYTSPQKFFNQNQSAVLLAPLNFDPNQSKQQVETQSIIKTGKQTVKNSLLRPSTQQSQKQSKRNTVILTYEQYGRMASKNLIKPNYFEKLADINDHILSKQSKMANKTNFRQLFQRKEKIEKKIEKRQYFKQVNKNCFEEKINTIATCNLSALSSHIILQKLEDKWQLQYAQDIKKRALALTEESEFGSNTFGSHREEQSNKPSYKFRQEVTDRVTVTQSINNSVDSKLKPFFERIFGGNCQLEKQSNQHDLGSENEARIKGPQKRRSFNFSSTKNRRHKSFKPMLEWKSH